MKSGKTKEGAKKSSKPKQNEQETLKIRKTPKLPLTLLMQDLPFR
jgi:hypothetical protein